MTTRQELEKILSEGIFYTDHLGKTVIHLKEKTLDKLEALIIYRELEAYGRGWVERMKNHTKPATLANKERTADIKAKQEAWLKKAQQEQRIK